MPRIRTIKPEFFTSEDVVALTPLARLLFVALWCEADREGRLEWRPVTLKLRYFPGDDVDIDKLATEMEPRRMLVRYEVDGRRLARLPGFTKHQFVNNREAASDIPEPPVLPRPTATRDDATGTRTDASVTREHARVKEVIGKEHSRASRTRDATRDPRFARFWEHFPKKVGRQDALKAWGKLNPDDALAERIIAAVRRAAASDDWRKDAGKYVPHPSTFLNGRRFEDEIGASRSAAPAQLPY